MPPATTTICVRWCSLTSFRSFALLCGDFSFASVPSSTSPLLNWAECSLHHHHNVDQNWEHSSEMNWEECGAVKWMDGLRVIWRTVQEHRMTVCDCPILSLPVLTHRCQSLPYERTALWPSRVTLLLCHSSVLLRVMSHMFIFILTFFWMATKIIYYQYCCISGFWSSVDFIVLAFVLSVNFCLF